MSKIAILGSGSMGIAVSVLLDLNGHDVVMWTPIQEEADMLNKTREHKDRLPGIKIPERIKCTTDFGEALKDIEAVILTVPSQRMRETAIRLKNYVDDETILISCSKGIEEKTGMILTDVLKEELPRVKVAAISGPSYAIEIARQLPTALVCASSDPKVALFGQNLFMNANVRVYASDDMLGVEIGGAIKNVIAFCAGISDGLGFGYNTKAALITRGLTEITRLGIAMGAEKSTFSGLTGMGDLILTCTGEYSRNRRAGILVGEGMSVQEAIKEVNMVVEGVATARPAYELSKKYNVSMPIITQAYNIIHNGLKPKDAVVDLMSRDKKYEDEDSIV